MLKLSTTVLNPSMETVVIWFQSYNRFWMCPKLKFGQTQLATTRNLTNTLIRMVNAPSKMLDSKYFPRPFRFCKHHLFSGCTSLWKVKKFFNMAKVTLITYARCFKLLRKSSWKATAWKAVWDSSKARHHNMLNFGKAPWDNLMRHPQCQNAWKSTF